MLPRHRCLLESWRLPASKGSDVARTYVIWYSVTVLNFYGQYGCILRLSLYGMCYIHVIVSHRSYPLSM